MIGGGREEGEWIGWARGALWGGGLRGEGGAHGGHWCTPGCYLCVCCRIQGEGTRGERVVCDHFWTFGVLPAHGWCLCLQDGRADVVANDAGDRVTPAVVAFSESEEVRLPLCVVDWGGTEGRELGAALCSLLFFLLFHAGCWLSCKAK